MRQGETLAGCAAAQQELTHRRGHSHTDRANVTVHVLHRVVDGQTVGDRPSRRVDVETDVLIAVLSFEQQQLRADAICRVLIDLGAEEHYPFSKESLIQIV